MDNDRSTWVNHLVVAALFALIVLFSVTLMIGVILVVSIDHTFLPPEARYASMLAVLYVGLKIFMATIKRGGRWIERYNER